MVIITQGVKADGRSHCITYAKLRTSNYVPKGESRDREEGTE